MATLAFNIFRNVDHALLQQLLGAVKDNSVRVKHRPHREYSGSITLDMLIHLYNTYAAISNTDWLANKNRFREAYSSTDPIEVAWRHIDDAVAYTDVGSIPNSTKQVVDNAYQLVFNTGIFAADFWEWNKQVAADKTLPYLKVFLAAAHREC